MINLLKDLKFSKNSAKFFRKARAGREFPSPSTPFLPAPPERFGILRNARGVSLKKGSRIFNYSPPNRILQIFGSGQRGSPCLPARQVEPLLPPSKNREVQYGARERIRTSKPLRALPPQGSASASFATRAFS